MSLIANIDDIIASFNQNRDELKNFWTDHEKFNDPFQSKTIEFRKQFYVNYPLDKIDSIPNSNSFPMQGSYTHQDQLKMTVCDVCIVSVH